LPAVAKAVSNEQEFIFVNLIGADVQVKKNPVRTGFFEHSLDGDSSQIRSPGNPDETDQSSAEQPESGGYRNLG
jgi:hypothetical protein